MGIRGRSRGDRRMKELICSTCEEEFEDYHERKSDDFILIENEYGEYYCYNCGNNELNAVFSKEKE